MFFEKYLFRRLIMRHSAISKFGQLLDPRRRGLLQHLWVRIERPEDPIVTETLLQLFKIMSSWKKEETNNKLTLELSDHYPSDHRLAPYEYDCRPYPHIDDEDCAYEELYAHMSRKKTDYQWYFTFVRKRRPHQIFSRSPDLDPSSARPRKQVAFPKAEVVKSLLIRRQYACNFSPDTLFGIIRSLPGLETIRLEGYNGFKYGFTNRLEDCFRSTDSLKTLSIFDEGELFRHTSDGHTMENLHSPVGAALANNSGLLENLSIGFAVDAGDFFQGFWPGNPPAKSQAERRGGNHRTADNRALRPGQTLDESANEKWPVLKSLALTSKLLHPDTPENLIGDLLRAAANAALQMPSLQQLEIWNQSQKVDFMCIFTYQRHGNDGYPTITLSNTWGYELKPDVVSSWNKVAEKYEHHQVTVWERDLDLEGLDSNTCGAVVSYLQLRRLVLHPVSMCQIMCEHDAAKDWNNT